MEKSVVFTKELMQKELDGGALFVWEKYLDSLPLDWIDCVMFTAFSGMDKEAPHSLFLNLDEEASIKAFKLIGSEVVKVFVLPDDRKNIWQVMFTRHHNEESGEDERLLVGGENFRKYLDERNIYYKSMIDSDGKLISGSCIRYQKKDGEDCRTPVNHV